MKRDYKRIEKKRDREQENLEDKKRLRVEKINKTSNRNKIK